MKNPLVLILAVLFSLPAFAAGPFGAEAKNIEFKNHDPSGCVGSFLVSREFFRNGVDVTEGKAPYAWGCEGVGASNAREKRCPYPQYLKESKDPVRCFSNTASGGISVCVVAGRSERVRVNGEGGAIKYERKARFQQLFVLSTTADGFRKDRQFTMDDAGCKVEAAQSDDTGSTMDVDVKKCTDLFQRMLTGGVMHPGTSEAKFNDATTPENRSDRISSYRSHIAKLNFCMENIPGFVDDLEKSNQSPRGRPATGTEAPPPIIRER